jgi:hypothetical protein
VDIMRVTFVLTIDRTAARLNARSVVRCRHVVLARHVAIDFSESHREMSQSAFLVGVLCPISAAVSLPAQQPS